MSVDSSAYVGPFALCKNEKVDKTRVIRACINEACENHSRHRYDNTVKFCDKCGSDIDEFTMSYSGWKVVWGDLIEEIDQVLCIASQECGFQHFSEEMECWIANRWSDEVGASHFDPRRECFAFLPDQECREKSIQAFKDKFSEALAKLTEAYGEGNVEINWGFLCWLS